MKIWSILGISFLWYATISGQDSVLIQKPLDVFRKGQAIITLRNSTMATINQDSLRDYVANAQSIQLGFKTAPIKGFSAKISMQAAINVLDNQLTKTDVATGKRAVWEIELFDIQHPNEKTNLDRLEELYVQYKKAAWNIRLGKIDINQGPLLLSRHGRMKAFLFSGIYANYKAKNHDFYGGWITGVAPRGMTRWFSIDEAIGLTNNGFNYDGTKSSYQMAANSKGIGLLAWEGNHEKWRWKVWQFYFDKLMQTNWLEMDFSTNNWRLGAQYVFQSSLAAQDRLTDSQQFFHPDQQAHVVSAELAKKLKNWRLSAAWLRSFNQGRFLFPRDLGRENFYVSQPRSWVDGFGNLSVYQLRVKYTLTKRLSADFRLSHWDTPEKDDYKLNKYGRADYTQITADIRYKFKDRWEGLSLRFIYAGRFSDAEDLKPADIFYRTNFHHFNLIVDYRVVTKK